jgi:hypothetical protein
MQNQWVGDSQSVGLDSTALSKAPYFRTTPHPWVLPTHKDLIFAFCVDFPTYHKWVVHQSSLVFMRSHLFVVAFEVAE